MTLTERINAVRLLILDVDGVMTDGKLYFTAEGQTCKAFDVKDGHGIRLLLHYGIDVAVISGRESAAVRMRLEDLGIQKAYLGRRDKLAALEELLASCNVSAAQTAYLGDDLPDLAVMTQVNLACATADANPEIKKRAHCVLNTNGGHGAVRELSEKILTVQGHWETVLSYYSS